MPSHCGVCRYVYLHGTDVSDIDECEESNGGCNQVCRNSPGTYRCTCFAGYELTDDGSNCTDIDECLENTGVCGVKPHSECENTAGGFACSCIDGFNPVGDYCEDIDECAKGDFICEQNCVNIIASYDCTCRNGYTLNADNYSCDDINECDDDGVCNDTTSQCVNKKGGYECLCLFGHHRSSDQSTCVHIDDCLKDRGLCDCSDLIGNYSCVCQKGYFWDHNDAECRDVNECLAGTHACTGRNMQCENTDGGYRCKIVGKWQHSVAEFKIIVMRDCFLISAESQRLLRNVTPGFSVISRLSSLFQLPLKCMNCYFINYFR